MQKSKVKDHGNKILGVSKPCRSTAQHLMPFDLLQQIWLAFIKNVFLWCLPYFYWPGIILQGSQFQLQFYLETAGTVISGVVSIDYSN